MSDTSAFLATLGLSAFVLAAAFGALWRVAERRNDVSIVDILWGPSFVLVSAVAAPLGRGDPTLRVLLPILASVWGLRLGAYLAARNLGRGEDPRYTALRNKVGAGFDRYALTHIFVFQAAIAWVVSMPIQVGVHLDAAPTALTWLGVAVWCVGFAFETVGDRQLGTFKRDPANAGRVMDRGLWRYTRHPNYFGDACVWWGLYLVAATHWLGALTIVAPALITFMLVRVTGKRLLERRLTRSRPGYAEYVARTSGFFPLPPRRRAITSREGVSDSRVESGAYLMPSRHKNP